MLLTGAGLAIGSLAGIFVARLLSAAVPEVHSRDIWINITVCLTVIAMTFWNVFTGRVPPSGPERSSRGTRPAHCAPSGS
jgi:uncharacterized membrane protein YfcA